MEEIAMPVDPKAYLTELAQQAGLDASVRDTMLKALDNPNFAKGIQDGVTRQSEFSRSMDDLRNQAAALAENRDKWQKWHDANVTYVKELETKTGVDPSRRATPTNDGTVTLTQAQLDKALEAERNKVTAIGVNITKAAVRVMDDYRSRFGEALDLDALEKLALEKILSIDAAYKEVIAPKVTAQQEIAQKKSIEDGIKAGVSAELSKRNLPIDSAPADAAEPSPFWQKPAGDQAAALSEGQRARNFADTWNTNAGV
jgi:hypothetical protein